MKFNFFFLIIISLLIFSCKKPERRFYCGQTITDVSGNTYNTVSIGNQCWMKENLKTKYYNNGIEIPKLSLTNGSWEADSLGGYAFKDDQSFNDSIYGKLYNWYAVNTGKLAPKGWHVSTDNEWITLINYLGGDTVAAKKMLEDYNNSSGFTALYGDQITNTGSWINIIGYKSYFWTSTETRTGGAWFYAVGAYDMLPASFIDTVAHYNVSKKYGFSVRCVKD